MHTVTPPFTGSYRYVWSCMSNGRTKSMQRKQAKDKRKGKKGKGKKKRRGKEEGKRKRGQEKGRKREDRGKNEEPGKKVERKGGNILSVVRDYFSNKWVSLRYCQGYHECHLLRARNFVINNFTCRHYVQL